MASEADLLKQAALLTSSSIPGQDLVPEPEGAGAAGQGGQNQTGGNTKRRTECRKSEDVAGAVQQHRTESLPAHVEVFDKRNSFPSCSDAFGFKRAASCLQVTSADMSLEVYRNILEVRECHRVRTGHCRQLSIHVFTLLIPQSICKYFGQLILNFF